MSIAKKTRDKINSYLTLQGYQKIKPRHDTLKAIALVLILLGVNLNAVFVAYMRDYNWCPQFNFRGKHYAVACLDDDNGNLLDLTKIKRSDFPASTYIYDRYKKQQGQINNEIRDPVRLSEMDPIVPAAFVAAEDKRFYQHHGVDWMATTVAAAANLSHKFLGVNLLKREGGGASTITQQVARRGWDSNVRAFREREPNLWRKLKEARLAMHLEKIYTKSEILEFFLNEVYLGHGGNGVCAERYRIFGEDCRVDKSSIQEAAKLASMNKNPSLYDPIFHSDRGDKEVIRMANSKKRYNAVMERMVEIKAITRQEYEENKFKIDENPRESLAKLHPWKNPIFSYANRWVKEFLLFQGHKDPALSSSEGLRVYTTIDPRIQVQLSDAFERHIELLRQESPECQEEMMEGKPDPKDCINGSFVVIHIPTGEIWATSGGYKFKESEYPRQFAYRSPGSGLKPLVILAALESGKVDLFTRNCNTPFHLKGANGKVWAPQNFKEKNARPADCNRATWEIVTFSLNLGALHIAMNTTMPPIIDQLHALGIDGNPGVVKDSDGNVWFKRPYSDPNKGGLVPLLPTAIGASDINLMELANAYAAIFRGGIYKPPTFIKEIRNMYGDKVVYQAPVYEGKRVADEDNVYKVLAMMRAVTEIGTTKISMRGVEYPIACKTGTSNGPRDISVWCGTPEVFIGMRFGYDDNRIIKLPVYMKKMSGDNDMLVSAGWVVGPLARKMHDTLFKIMHPDGMYAEFPWQVEDYNQQILDSFKK